MRLFVSQLNNFTHDFKNYVVKQDKKSEDFIAVESKLLKITQCGKFEGFVSYNWQSGFPIFIFVEGLNTYIVSDTQIKVFGSVNSFEITLEV